MLVNYWWDAAPELRRAARGAAACVLTIRDLPPDQRAVWESMFQQLVFSAPDSALAHLAPAQRGMLAAPSEERTRKIRETLAREFGR